ncbi:MAG: hypothetical protein V7L00_32515 [Nostoc sp.]|uniref:beta strand repeat-containing protein n=1 Tax=Nostoc sp. TaxID=1180 RepID=UPI002FF6EB03
MSTFTVTNTNNSGASSLRQQILNADLAGGTNIINFGGLFSDVIAHTINLTGSGLSITDDLTIQGTNPSLLTIKDDTADRVFDIGKGVTSAINGLTITNSYDGANGGGAISNEGILTLNNTIIKGNTVTNNIILNGELVGGEGGGIYNSGNLTLNHSTISGNNVNTGTNTVANSNSYRSTSEGGGIYNSGNLTLNHSTISGNNVIYSYQNQISEGGGIYNTGNLTVENSTISDNTATSSSFEIAIGLGEGGGIYTTGILTVENSTISGNSAEDGGGIIIENLGDKLSLLVENSTISNNTATYNGGAIYHSGKSIAKVNYSTISGNLAMYDNGGGIWNGGLFTLNYSTISNNKEYGSPVNRYGGGGIYNLGTLSVNYSTISGNTANSNDGGGITNVYDGTLSVNYSTISGNTAHFGGGIYNLGYSNNLGIVIVNHSTISGNQAHFGGGIYNDGTLTVGNSTIRHNKAFGIELSPGQQESGKGGGIYNSDSSYATATIDYSTVACNFDTPEEDSNKFIKLDNLVGKFITKGSFVRV